MKGTRKFFLIFMMAVVLSGCATTKGTVTGLQEDSKTFAKALGALGHMIMKADGWIKENLW